MVKKHNNTVLGYKKGSKTKSENEQIFFDPKLYIELFCNFVKNLIVLCIWRWLFQEPAWDEEKRFFLAPKANMRFLTIIFEGRRLQMTLSKFPMSNVTSGQHVVNRSWLKSPKSAKNTLSRIRIFRLKVLR